MQTFQPEENQEMDIHDITCPVCRELITIYAFGSCDHAVCYKCATRMRVLCELNYCAICRAQLSQVVMCTTQIPFKEVAMEKMPESRRYNIWFENQLIKQKFYQLMENVCPYCPDRPADRAFEDLSRHIRRKHEMFYCDLCVLHVKLFPSERKCYNRQLLATHRQKGDPDDTSHKGHPMCQFCSERYLDKDELLRHLCKEHFYCHFCDDNHYYSDYGELRTHFLSSHFLCEEADCVNARFTNAFSTEVDLRLHRVETHLKTKSQMRQELTLDVQLRLPPRGPEDGSRGGHDGRRGGRGRGGSRGRGRGGNRYTDHRRSPTADTEPMEPIPDTDDMTHYPTLGPNGPQTTQQSAVSHDRTLAHRLALATGHSSGSLNFVTSGHNYADNREVANVANAQNVPAPQERFTVIDDDEIHARNSWASKRQVSSPSDFPSLPVPKTPKPAVTAANTWKSPQKNPQTQPKLYNQQRPNFVNPSMQPTDYPSLPKSNRTQKTKYTASAVDEEITKKPQEKTFKDFLIDDRRKDRKPKKGSVNDSYVDNKKNMYKSDERINENFLIPETSKKKSKSDERINEDYLIPESKKKVNKSDDRMYDSVDGNRYKKEKMDEKINPPLLVSMSKKYDNKNVKKNETLKSREVTNDDASKLKKDGDNFTHTRDKNISQNKTKPDKTNINIAIKVCNSSSISDRSKPPLYSITDPYSSQTTPAETLQTPRLSDKLQYPSLPKSASAPKLLEMTPKTDDGKSRNINDSKVKKKGDEIKKKKETPKALDKKEYPSLPKSAPPTKSTNVETDTRSKKSTDEMKSKKVEKLETQVTAPKIQQKPLKVESDTKSNIAGEIKLTKVNEMKDMKSQKSESSDVIRKQHTSLPKSKTSPKIHERANTKSNESNEKSTNKKVDETKIFETSSLSDKKQYPSLPTPVQKLDDNLIVDTKAKKNEKVKFQIPPVADETQYPSLLKTQTAKSYTPETRVNSQVDYFSNTIDTTSQVDYFSKYNINDKTDSSDPLIPAFTSLNDANDFPTLLTTTKSTIEDDKLKSNKNLSKESKIGAKTEKYTGEYSLEPDSSDGDYGNKFKPTNINGPPDFNSAIIKSTKTKADMIICDKIKEEIKEKLKCDFQSNVGSNRKTDQSKNVDSVQNDACGKLSGLTFTDNKTNYAPFTSVYPSSTVSDDFDMNSFPSLDEPSISVSIPKPTSKNPTLKNTTPKNQSPKTLTPKNLTPKSQSPTSQSPNLTKKSTTAKTSTALANGNPQSTLASDAIMAKILASTNPNNSNLKPFKPDNAVQKTNATCDPPPDSQIATDSIMSKLMAGFQSQNPTNSTPKPPPPGFTITPKINSSITTIKKPPPGFTAVNSSLPNAPPTKSRAPQDYFPPPDHIARNKQLISDIRMMLENSDDRFAQFKSLSTLFRQGDASADEYYARCNDLFNHGFFTAIFPELLVLLPDIAKQGQLLATYARRVGKNAASQSQFVTCSTCKQVLLGTDYPHHVPAH